MIEFSPVEWHEELSSTNTYLVEWARRAPDLRDGMVVAARVQTAGRGRQGRSWQAAPNRNLTFSFLIRPSAPADYIPSLAQAVAVGIARYLERQGVTATVKWPNDVLAGDKKIGGILCERAGVAWVVGVGLNINMTAEDAAAIDQPATSLAIETGRSHRIEAVLEDLLGELQGPLAAWEHGGFSSIRDDYESFGLPRGAEIRVRDGDQHVAGTLAGFSEYGGLRLGLPDGSERLFYSGDVQPAERMADRREA